MSRRARVALLVVLVLVCSACPKSNDLDRAAKASNEFAHDLIIANQVVAEFYKAGKIPLGNKDKIADKLDLLGSKGEKFNALLIELDQKYPQGTLPPQSAQFIRDNLSELRGLYTDIIRDLLPFKAQAALDSFNKHLTTVEGVANK